LRDTRSDSVTEEYPRLLGYDTEQQTGHLKTINIIQRCDPSVKNIHPYVSLRSRHDKPSTFCATTKLGIFKTNLY